MKKYLPIVATILIAFVAPAFSQSKPNPQSFNERVVEKELEKSISVDLEEQEFSTLVSTLKSKYQLDIIVDQSAVDAGLGPDDLVTFKYSDTRARIAFDNFLSRYDASYTIKDNRILVYANEQAHKHLRVKIYPCREILATIKPKLMYQRVSRQSLRNRGLARGPGGPAFRLPDRTNQEHEQTVEKKSAPKTKTTQETRPATTTMVVPQPPARTKSEIQFSDKKVLVGAAEQLIRVIESSVEPDSWDGVGTISELNGLLVVAQTEKAHIKIRRFLDEFKKLNKK